MVRFLGEWWPSATAGGLDSELHSSKQRTHRECVPETMRTAICDAGTLADILHSFVVGLCERRRITSGAVSEWPLHRKPLARVDPLLHLVRDVRFQESLGISDRFCFCA